MTVTPSRQYKKQAEKAGVSQEIVRRVLQYKDAITTGEVLLTLGHLCFFVDVEYNYLRKIIARKHDPYRSFTIKKRSGGTRNISVPEPRLLKTQKWIADNILKVQQIHPNCKSYHPKCKIFDCASVHTNAQWLVKVDIKNFFESIHEVDIYDLFFSWGYPPLVSFELARICTRVTEHKNLEDSRWVRKNKKEYKIKSYENQLYGCLPQGAPTSPFISNLILKDADEILTHMSDSLGFSYTRYADDLSFSSDDKKITRKHCLDLVRRVEAILSRHDLSINETKLSICPPGARKVVLGLLVDGDHPKLTRTFKSRIKNHIRNIEKHGAKAHSEHLSFDSTIGMLRHVRGLLSYSVQIEQDFGEHWRDRFFKALPIDLLESI